MLFLINNDVKTPVGFLKNQVIMETSGLCRYFVVRDYGHEEGLLSLIELERNEIIQLSDEVNFKLIGYYRAPDKVITLDGNVTTFNFSSTEDWVNTDLKKYYVGEDFTAEDYSQLAQTAIENEDTLILYNLVHTLDWDKDVACSRDVERHPITKEEFNCMISDALLVNGRLYHPTYDDELTYLMFNALGAYSCFLGQGRVKFKGKQL